MLQGNSRVALAGDPARLDMHQEQTFIVTVPLSPCDAILGQFSPHEYPQAVGDLAKSWQVSNDHLIHTFTSTRG
jgi:hypothetical protein